ncbi:DNA-directed RNA polymerase subunit epsilon [Paucilactobacillus suebicus]|uniref:DNA-directed RNA polymerase subunit epsilon n=1 Tax=Paucilactobacillus suebicus DSM 5007 = KCTC 3549 TaxID=1423807 RepID=A0A0R1W4T9_9LACO|nr:DNA-directed RNA polymerase subunit epsilon [Paucilactobacillus suebicus]KRM12530.1 hypothetical protein FD16_GL002281 [Paucilactobacillus suebicus DSM 5007 = KCTC 3549]
MIYKVYYQDTKVRNPKRENTHSLFLDEQTLSAARETAEKNTDINVEYIEELSEEALNYEKQNPDFKISKF